MDSLEFTVIGLNFVIIIVGYLVVYPKFAGNSFKKIALCDLVATALSLLIVASQCWNTGYAFNMLVFEANWFWFTVITYLVIEIPFMQWYFKKHGVDIDIER